MTARASISINSNNGYTLLFEALFILTAIMSFLVVACWGYLAILMAVLALVVAFEMARAWYNALRKYGVTVTQELENSAG